MEHFGIYILFIYICMIIADAVIIYIERKSDDKVTRNILYIILFLLICGVFFDIRLIYMFHL